MFVILDTLAASTPGISVNFLIKSQWTDTFDGDIILTYSGGVPVSQWSVSFTSRYQLRSVSNFTLQQTQQADGTWLITLSPPSWGTTLVSNSSYSSYLQGKLPSGTQLTNLSGSDVLTTSSSTIPTTVVVKPTESVVGTSTTTSTSTSTTKLPISSVTPSNLAPGGTNSGNAADALWGESFFAPYVDLGLYPVPDLDGLARKYGVGLFTLGFIQSTPSGEAAWAGIPALSLTSTNEQAVALRQEISQLRAVGGDVMVSFGGAGGISLAEQLSASGSTAAELASRYGKVVDILGLNRIDFDIEGAAVANRASNKLLAESLVILQKSIPALEVWYTLPVLPQGLTNDGLEVVRQALAAGVKLDGINIMAMDYGDSAAPPALQSMGKYAIDAANTTFLQLTSLFNTFGQGFGWNQLGITPMIGVNDITSEVFTTADAQLVEDFARSKGLGMISMWSVARDNPGSLGQTAINHSGTNSPAGSYSTIWGDYGTDPIISGGVSGGVVAGTSGSIPALAPLASTTITVASTATTIAADSATAERFQLSYAWGRKLTINGFDPTRDVLDLKGFWSEGSQARVHASPGGASVMLDFNSQQILLPGVDAGLLTPSVLEIWKG